MPSHFNTPQAIACLFDLAREINQAGDSGLSFLKAQSVLSELAQEVLGLKLPQITYVEVSDKISMRATVDATVISDAVSARVNRLIEERIDCRETKNWQRADEIRNKLAELGVTLEDTKARTDVTYKSVPSEESLDSLMGELGIPLGDD